MQVSEALLIPLFTKMVQMGHIMRARVSDQDRADVIVEHARKKMLEATDSFHSTLDDMEIEIVSPGHCLRMARPSIYD